MLVSRLVPTWRGGGGRGGGRVCFAGIKLYNRKNLVTSHDWLIWLLYNTTQITSEFVTLQYQMTEVLCKRSLFREGRQKGHRSYLSLSNSSLSVCCASFAFSLRDVICYKCNETSVNIPTSHKCYHSYESYLAAF